MAAFRETSRSATILLTGLMLATVTAPWGGSEARDFAGQRPAVEPVSQVDASQQDRVTVVEAEPLGLTTFPTGFTFRETEVGGLSGITYDPERGVFYALSDDRGDIDPSRFYTVEIDMSDGTLDDGDVRFLEVWTLRAKSGGAFAPGDLDPEGIALNADSTVYISSEGDVNATPQVDPFIREFTLSGRFIGRGLEVPDAFLPTADGASGIRNNLAFESLTVTPDGSDLYVATENALVQDGPAADLEAGSLSRIIRYTLPTERPTAQFVYLTEPVAAAPVPADGFSTNGLVELLALDNNGTLLALERSYSAGVGNTVKLYEVLTQGALDVSARDALCCFEGDEPFEIDPAVSKRLLLDFADLGIVPDNLEGMTFGPDLPDGRKTLIVVSDNNFSETQVTQFVALALTVETTPAALPVKETPQAIDDADAESTLTGDSDDPAIWVHPRRPGASLIIATQKDGGLVVFDLDGAVRQTIRPTTFGGARFNNVDIVYGFAMGSRHGGSRHDRTGGRSDGAGDIRARTGPRLEDRRDGDERDDPRDRRGIGRLDLAVVSDRENDTLAIFAIDPKSRTLVDVTARRMIDSIFGVDDGDRTAYGLTTYRSPFTGQTYAFVTQASGNQVAQLELVPTRHGRVTAHLVRMIGLPVPTGEVEDSQAEGMVADRQLGWLYVGMETEVGVLRFDAEPYGGSDYVLVAPIDAPYFKPDIEGLTLYYSPGDFGYLLVSSQGDSTIAVFDRGGYNTYLGSFVIGGVRSPVIDQVNESDGADVVNVRLGPTFPYGLLVVQDGADDPQSVVEDDEELENQATNFKLVPWEGVANAFAEPLMIAPFAYDPRHPLRSLYCGEDWPGRSGCGGW